MTQITHLGQPGTAARCDPKIHPPLAGADRSETAAAVEYPSPGQALASIPAWQAPINVRFHIPRP